MIRSSGVAPSGLPKVMRFGLVGVAATATDFTVFNLGLLLAAPSSRLAVIALNTLAFATATFVSYQLNTRFTFAATRGRQALLRYLLVALGGAVVYNGALLAALFIIPARDTLLLNVAKTGAVVLSATWNFIGFGTFALVDRRAIDDEQDAA